ncbi:MAG: hypothetical protein IT384_29235 [Deltaproteobacteria bacterium]|nr:hypothetical protein [Deltaproteobacteria bacterium]
MSTIWVLDDGPFGLLARFFDPNQSWPAAVLHLVEEVAASAQNDKSGRRQKLLNLLDASGNATVVVRRIVVGTAAADFLFKHLRPFSTSATRDLGEDASIALCAVELTESVFVTMDKGAAYQALAELGPGRVATPFDCWYELKAAGLISEASYKDICEATWKNGAIAGQPRRFPLPTS